jgi:lipopolysaccharide transport system permease protein
VILDTVLQSLNDKFKKIMGMKNRAHGTSQLRFIIDLTKRDFKLRYLGSILGSYWNLIHPLVMILIYTLIFSRLMRARLGNDAGPFSYSIYLCSGLLPWNLFSEAVQRLTTTLLDNASFIKKVSLDPLTLFGATLLSSVVNFFIALTIFVIAASFVKTFSIPLLLAYLGVAILFSLFGLGIGIGLGCLNVFIRDVQHLLSVIFQLWFWFTPVVYLSDTLPVFAQEVLKFNPAYPFIKSLHNLLYYQSLPDPKLVLAMFIWTALALTLGLLIYKRSISFARDQL